ncbi:MAG: hypothetical protein V3W31_03010 [Thermodesulfobacteriota bacterium]
MESTVMILAAITAAALLLNMPFGYMRASAKKFSVMWFLYIHIPIPFIFALRSISGFTYKAIPVIAVGAVLGQFIGGRMNHGK